MYGLQCLNWNLYFHFGTHKNTKGMVPHWCGTYSKKASSLFKHDASTGLTLWLWSSVSPVGSTPGPGYRSQKRFRNRQKATDSLQERSCHPAFLLYHVGHNLPAWPHGEAIIIKNILVVELKVLLKKRDLSSGRTVSVTPPSWNGKLSSLPSLRLSRPSSHLHFNVLNISLTLIWYTITKQKKKSYLGLMTHAYNPSPGGWSKWIMSLRSAFHMNGMRKGIRHDGGQKASYFRITRVGSNCGFSFKSYVNLDTFPKSSSLHSFVYKTKTILTCSFVCMVTLTDTSCISYLTRPTFVLTAHLTWSKALVQ